MISLLSPAEQTECAEYESGLSSDFIRNWVAYGESRTHAPVAFHRSVAYVLVAAAIDRHRWLHLQHKRVYPSLYALNLAPSGAGKSIPLSYGEGVALAALKDRVLSNEYSAESLVMDLSGKAKSKGVSFVDEAGKLLKSMQKAGYAEGLKDIFSKLWDCPPTYTRTLMKGTFTLSEVYFCMVVAATVSRFLEMVTPEDIASGFLARFLPTVVTEKSPLKPLAVATPKIDALWNTLGASLAAIRAAVAQAPGPMPITPDALLLLNRVDGHLAQWADKEYESDLIGPWAQRLSEDAARLSIIFAVSEGAPQVDRLQALRAIQAVDRAKEHALTLVGEIVKGATAREMDKVERFIRQQPGILTKELLQRTHIPTGRLKPILQALVDEERIVGKKDKGERWYPGVAGLQVAGVADHG